jgi:hypothetical protein
MDIDSDAGAGVKSVIRDWTPRPPPGPGVYGRKPPPEGR